MSRSWTPEELKLASEAMKAAGHLSFEEFLEAYNLKEEDQGGRETIPNRIHDR